MDVERALAELGLGRQFTGDELRRAYLRAVRRHPPERDPEGFQRVREANDLLRFVALRLQSEARPAEQRPAPEPEPETAPEPAAPPRELEEPPAAPAPAPPSLRFTGGEDPEQDARVLISAFDQTLAGAVALPPPYACFVVILELVAKGKPELAQQLWQSFDRRATAEGWGAREFPPELAARWQIVREVIELLGRVPKRMTRALARATLKGEYYQAAEAVEEALLLEGEGMQHVFSKRAPTLYAAVWPAVDAARRTAPQPSSGSFRSGPPWWLMALLASIALRFCAQLGKDSPSAGRAAITMPAPRVERSPEPPAPFAEPAVDFDEVRQRQLQAVGTAVDDALAHNDCGMLGEQWPLYTAALRGSAEPERSAFERRRAEARLRCQELAQQLEVEP